MSAYARRKQDRANALAVAEHAYAIQRARAITRDEALQQALIRLGPVPSVCRQCQQRPPTIYVVHGSGEWVCRTPPSAWASRRKRSTAATWPRGAAGGGSRGGR